MRGLADNAHYFLHGILSGARVVLLGSGHYSTALIGLLIILMKFSYLAPGHVGKKSEFGYTTYKKGIFVKMLFAHISDMFGPSPVWPSGPLGDNILQLQHELSTN